MSRDPLAQLLLRQTAVTPPAERLMVESPPPLGQRPAAGVDRKTFAALCAVLSPATATSGSR